TICNRLHCVVTSWSQRGMNGCRRWRTTGQGTGRVGTARGRRRPAHALVASCDRRRWFAIAGAVHGRWWLGSWTAWIYGVALTQLAHDLLGVCRCRFIGVLGPSMPGLGLSQQVDHYAGPRVTTTATTRPNAEAYVAEP